MKNLLLLAITLGSVFSMNAQLFVKPNGSQESYVYVKDEVLYVEQDVELEDNDPGASNGSSFRASLYLRGDAQLIQGSTGDLANKGTGLLSVYQTIDETSNYHYTFWNPPVGITSLDGGFTALADGNTDAGVSRYYDCDTCGEQTTAAQQAATTAAWNGSSVSDPFTISTRWIYKKIDSPDTENEANWVKSNGNDVPAGYGITMKGVSNPGNVGETISWTYDLRGRPNNGVITVPVASDGSTPRRVLVGNPYPSAIDLVEFWNDNPGITEVLFWDEPKDSEYSHLYVNKSGGYGTWVPHDGLPGSDPIQGHYVAPPFKEYFANGEGSITGASGADYPRRYSPIGQGFEVRTDGTTSVIRFENDQRIYQPEAPGVSIFYGPTTGYEEQPERAPFFKVAVLMDESYARQLLIAFNDDATDEFDRGYDGRSPMDLNTSDAYFPVWKQDTEMLTCVIQTLPFKMGKKIPLTINATEQIPVEVTVTEEHNLPAEVYLWDKGEHTFTQISDGEKASLLLNAGLYENRFYIVFRNPNPNSNSNINGLSPIVMDFFQNNPAKQLQVTNPEGYDIKEAQIFDMSGKLVYNGANLGRESNLTFPTAMFSDGVYLVKLTTSDHGTITHKINVTNK